MATHEYSLDNVVDTYFERATRSDLDGVVVIVHEDGTRDLLPVSLEDGPALLAEVRKRTGSEPEEEPREAPPEDRYEDDGGK